MRCALLVLFFLRGTAQMNAGRVRSYDHCHPHVI